jgi:hypothetical protein
MEQDVEFTEPPKAFPSEPMIQEAKAQLQATPEFQQKFKGTKVVDEQDQPKMVFHGTPEAGFTIFDPSKMGAHGTSEGMGMYFTDNPSRASRYAEGYKTGGAVYPVFLDIKKPMALEGRVITDKQLESIFKELQSENSDALANYGVDVEREGLKAALKAAVDIEKVNESDVDIMGSMVNGGIGSFEQIAAAVTKVTGYDGIISEWKKPKIDVAAVEVEPGENVYIAFRPEQIKSVWNERPTENPDILMEPTATLDVG